MTKTLRERIFTFGSMAAVLAVVAVLNATPAQAAEVTTAPQNNGSLIFNESDQSLSLREVRQASRGEFIREIKTGCDWDYSCALGDGFGTSPQSSVAAQSGPVTGVGYFDIPAYTYLGNTGDGTDVVYTTPSGIEVTLSARTTFLWIFGIPKFRDDHSACFVSSPNAETPAIECKVNKSRGIGSQTEFTIINK